MTIIVYSVYQHCDEQQFQTLSCALDTFFSVTKPDLVIQLALAVTIDYILAMEKKYAYTSHASCIYIKINIFEHI